MSRLGSFPCAFPWATSRLGSFPCACRLPFSPLPRWIRPAEGGLSPFSVPRNTGVRALSLLHSSGSVLVASRPHARVQVPSVVAPGASVPRVPGGISPLDGCRSSSGVWSSACWSLRVRPSCCHLPPPTLVRNHGPPALPCHACQVGSCPWTGASHPRVCGAPPVGLSPCPPALLPPPAANVGL